MAALLLYFEYHTQNQNPTTQRGEIPLREIRYRGVRREVNLSRGSVLVRARPWLGSSPTKGHLSEEYISDH